MKKLSQKLTVTLIMFATQLSFASSPSTPASQSKSTVSEPNSPSSPQQPSNLNLRTLSESIKAQGFAVYLEGATDDQKEKDRRHEAFKVYLENYKKPKRSN